MEDDPDEIRRRLAGYEALLRYTADAQARRALRELIAEGEARLRKLKQALNRQ